MFIIVIFEVLILYFSYIALLRACCIRVTGLWRHCPGCRWLHFYAGDDCNFRCWYLAIFVGQIILFFGLFGPLWMSGDCGGCESPSKKGFWSPASCGQGESQEESVSQRLTLKDWRERVGWARRGGWRVHRKMKTGGVAFRFSEVPGGKGEEGRQAPVRGLLGSKLGNSTPRKEEEER